MELTPNQARTQKARDALAIKTARRYEDKYVRGLELLGYTVTPPEKRNEPEND